MGPGKVAAWAQKFDYQSDNSRKQLVSSALQHDQCTVLYHFYVLRAGLVHEAGVFCTRVEDDPAGREAQQIVCPLRMMLGANVEREGVNIRYMGLLAQIADVFSGHIALFDAEGYDGVPVFAEHMGCPVCIAGGVGAGPYYNSRFVFGHNLILDLAGCKIFHC